MKAALWPDVLAPAQLNDRLSDQSAPGAAEDPPRARCAASGRWHSAARHRRRRGRGGHHLMPAVHLP
eukprot:3097444-Pyramimonas_sp.AAC.1